MFSCSIILNNISKLKIIFVNHRLKQTFSLIVVKYIYGFQKTATYRVRGKVFTYIMTVSNISDICFQKCCQLKTKIVSLIFMCTCIYFVPFCNLLSRMNRPIYKCHLIFLWGYAICIYILNVIYRLLNCRTCLMLFNLQLLKQICIQVIRV